MGVSANLTEKHLSMMWRRCNLIMLGQLRAYSQRTGQRGKREGERNRAKVRGRQNGWIDGESERDLLVFPLKRT